MPILPPCVRRTRNPYAAPVQRLADEGAARTHAGIMEQGPSRYCIRARLPPAALPARSPRQSNVGEVLSVSSIFRRPYGAPRNFWAAFPALKRWANSPRRTPRARSDPNSKGSELLKSTTMLHAIALAPSRNQSCCNCDTSVPHQLAGIVIITWYRQAAVNRVTSLWRTALKS